MASRNLPRSLTLLLTSPPLPTVEMKEPLIEYSIISFDSNDLLKLILAGYVIFHRKYASYNYYNRSDFPPFIMPSFISGVKSCGQPLTSC